MLFAMASCVVWAAYIGLPLWASDAWHEVLAQGLVIEKEPPQDLLSGDTGAASRGPVEGHGTTAPQISAAQVMREVEPLFADVRWTVASALVAIGVCLMYSWAVIGPNHDVLHPSTWMVKWPKPVHERVRDTNLFVAVMLPVWAMGWYAVCRIASCHLLMMVSVYRVFGWGDTWPGAYQLRVRPLHPDRCGGLAPLGRYALRFAYVLAAFATAMFALLILMGRLDAVVIVLALAYVVFAPALFFGFLAFAHAPMAESRKTLLDRISRKFEAEFWALRDGLERGDSWRGAADRVEELDRLHSLADRFPVWPFDTVSVRRFLLTVAAPITPVLLQVLQNVGNLVSTSLGLLKP